MTCIAQTWRLAPLILLASCAAQAPQSQSQLNLADTALSNGAPQLGLSIAQAELAQHPNNPQALLREGRAYLALKQPDQAAQAYRQALAASPEFVPALMELGKIELSAQPEQARELFTRATNADRTNAAPLNDQGIALDMLGRHPEAQRSYRAALARDQDLISAQVNLALSLAITGNATGALQILQPIAQSQHGTPRIRADLALILVRTGHETEARQVLLGDMPADQAEAVIARYRELDAPAR